MSGDENEAREALSGRKTTIRAAVALVIFAAVGLALAWLDDGQRYLWLKALHIIAVLSWMAGLLYMPRLFVYHSGSPVGSARSETFKLMERRLYRIIMTPAMIIAWCLGLYLAWTFHGFAGGWLHAKLAAVFVLSGVHGHFGRAVRAFNDDRREHGTRYWRLMNEVPTVLMIVVVILAVVKPF